tara:strand:+ start:148 stop:867 length:720 start_codon:yes stop_codon:yes gene_type:complete
MGDICLKVNNLVSSYRNFKISHITFDLKNGDILGLVGRSGSGKSTLIKTLIGLKKLNAGKINFFLNANKINYKSVLGYSPQENSLFPFLTLEENILTFARLHGMKTKDIKERMKYLLARLDLKYSKSKKINELSGGMKKRADLAVTLIHDPQIIILDEPFNGLDISLQRFIWELLKEFAEQGKIIIISSHMLSDIQKNCTQIGLIEKGTYYDTNELVKGLKSKGETSLEVFLDRLFSRR